MTDDYSYRLFISHFRAIDMGNIRSVFSSLVGKADSPSSSLRRLDVRSSSSGSIYVGGNSSCGVSNASESFVDNIFSNLSLSDDQVGQVDHMAMITTALILFIFKKIMSMFM